MILEPHEYELIEKGITRAQAKAVHKELPPGGVWRTIKGHHVYIKDGKVLAGSIPGVTVPVKKATKAQLAEHQKNIKTSDKKKTSSRTDTGTKTKGTKSSTSKNIKTTSKASTTKPTTTKKPTTSKAKGATKDAGATKKTTTAKTSKTTTATKKGAGTNAKSKATATKSTGSGKAVPKPKPQATTTKSKPKSTTTAAKTGRVAKPATKAKVVKPDNYGAIATQEVVNDRIEVKLNKKHPQSKAFMEKLRDNMGYTYNGTKDVWRKQNNRKQRGLIMDAIDEYKGGKAVDTEVSKTSKPTTKGTGRGDTSRQTSTSKHTTTAAKQGTTKSRTSTDKEISTTPQKKQASRSDVQKNRTLAYDVGEKIGGARKDDYEKSFKVEPTISNLEGLERMSPAVAQKMCVKQNILPKFDWAQEKSNGTDLGTAMIKKLIFDRIQPKPEENTPEGRKAYMQSMLTLHRHIAGIKDMDSMVGAMRELATLAGRGKGLKRANDALDRAEANARGGGYTNVDFYKQEQAKGIEAKKQLDFDPLGDKVVSFFTNFESRNASLRTVQKNLKTKSWDDYTDPKTGEKKPKQNHVKKWERKAAAEWLRVGGRSNKLQKPEQMMKDYGLRGVEFGNWVDDASGKYHLQRCGEAFSDLADMVGVDDKDVSLNNRLAIAFGARGKGGALAHYEPSKKVINMTKFGGAGSLAHEWGHAMDNILSQYSNGGTDSLNLASEGDIGDGDPKLKLLYSNLMNTIKAGNHRRKVSVDTSDTANRMANYYPSLRRMVANDHSPEGLQKAVDHQVQLIKNYHERDMLRNKGNLERYRLRGDAKGVKRIEAQIKRDENKLHKDIYQVPHYVAADYKAATGQDYKGQLEIPTGRSELFSRMKEMDGGGKAYWSSNAEMFARVFEARIEDKMSKNKRYNNYLVHGTTEDDVKKYEAPFPIGQERKDMFAAMDDLLNHVSKAKLLKKALELELLKSLGYTSRNAYNLDFTQFDEPIDEVIYIPLNRLKTPYQSDKATDWEKVQANAQRIANGAPMAPIEIGTDYDIHDGHHRYLASRLRKLTHVPCVVKAANEVERRRAIEGYQEVWKSIQTDPVTPGAFEEDEGRMFRGIGHTEYVNMMKNGYIQSKGTGNDDDKGIRTCFSNLRSQAEGYARSNFDLYDEPKAYVLSLPKPEWIEEDEHGELVAHKPVTLEGMSIMEIPKDTGLDSNEAVYHNQYVLLKHCKKKYGEKRAFAMLDDGVNDLIKGGMTNGQALAFLMKKEGLPICTNSQNHSDKL